MWENIFLKINLGMNTQARHLRKELWESVKDWGFWKESIFFKGADYQKFTVRFMYQQGVSVSAIREYLGYRDDGRIKELTGAAEEELAQKSTEYF